MRRRNGLVQVPSSWLQAVLEGYAVGQGALKTGKMVVPLAVDQWAYPKQIATLNELYPLGFIPLRLLLLSAGGSTLGQLFKSQGAYTLTLQVMDPNVFISTARHELRHLAQHIGDEVLKAQKRIGAHGAFGRPSKRATRALRTGKKVLKAKGGKTSATYFHSASEWQPWVGSTADEIVGRAHAKGLEPGPKLNAYIRKKVLSSAFYNLTAPSTRKELLRQVYAEVMRRW